MPRGWLEGDRQREPQNSPWSKDQMNKYHIFHLQDDAVVLRNIALCFAPCDENKTAHYLCSWFLTFTGTYRGSRWFEFRCSVNWSYCSIYLVLRCVKNANTTENTDVLNIPTCLYSVAPLLWLRNTSVLAYNIRYKTAIMAFSISGFRICDIQNTKWMKTSSARPNTSHSKKFLPRRISCWHCKTAFASVGASHLVVTIREVPYTLRICYMMVWLSRDLRNGLTDTLPPICIITDILPFGALWECTTSQ